MDRMGEATLQFGKRGDEFASAAAILTASGNGKLHRERKTEAKRSVKGVSRKDRHSKVLTARGARDRRVRLSPKTAILFYDVQERLGCDRASKAIDWLMKEAKAAIDALGDRPPAPPPESKYDDTVSGLDFFGGGAAPEELQASVGPLESFDVNSEIVRLQRFLSWNYADSAPLHYPAAAEFHLFAESSQQFEGNDFRDQELQTFKDAEVNSSFEQASSLFSL